MVHFSLLLLRRNLGINEWWVAIGQQIVQKIIHVVLAQIVDRQAYRSGPGLHMCSNSKPAQSDG